MTRVGLFIPCYVDQCYPQVGLAVVELLERFGVEVDFPAEQTCCGQPMANTGCDADAAPLAEKFYRIFKDYPYVVCPSGSCTAMVRHHYDAFLAGRSGFEQLKHKTFELTEFLYDVLRVRALQGRFAHRVGVHQSCHGLRELRLASSSELVVTPFGKVSSLLSTLDGIKLVELTRPDECCGFGGTFAVNEEAVSCMMGNDRIHDHETHGTEVLTGVDMSCLMHLDGLIRRQRKPIRVMHVAELLVEAGARPAGVAGAAGSASASSSATGSASASSSATGSASASSGGTGSANAATAPTDGPGYVTSRGTAGQAGTPVDRREVSP